VLEVEGGKVTSHEGNYEDYLRWKEAQTILGQGATLVVPKSDQKDGALAPEDQSATNTESSTEAAKDRPRRLNPIKQKQMEERCAFLEEETPRIEAAIGYTEEQLGVYVSAAETERLATLAAELRAQLAALTAEWEELMMQLDGQGALS
jgi:ATP-binding cassette subfamily F protein 3